MSVQCAKPTPSRSAVTPRTPARGSLLPSGKRSVAGTQAVLVDAAGNEHAYSLQPPADTFLHVTVGLHKLFEQRATCPWSDDPILEREDFANVFRIIDRNAQYIIRVVIQEGPKAHAERVFRVLLFGLFDRIETYEFLRAEFGVPSLKTFDRKAWSRALDAKMERGDAVFTGVYQNNPPGSNIIGQSSSAERTLRLLELMMATGFAGDIAECEELGGMQATITRYHTMGHTMGQWLGYQRVLDLNMIPSVMLPKDWALPGPSAKIGLRLVFGERLPEKHFSCALLWLFNNVNTLFAEAGYAKKDIPALIPSSLGLSAVDLELVLCEFATYVKIQTKTSRDGEKPKAPSTREGNDMHVTRVLPKKWTPALQAFAGYADLSGANKEYEVTAIIKKGQARSGTRYLVRWVGYGPEDDGWEPEEELQESVLELVVKFNQRQEQIQNMLREFRSGKL